MRHRRAPAILAQALPFLLRVCSAWDAPVEAEVPTLRDCSDGDGPLALLQTVIVSGDLHAEKATQSNAPWSNGDWLYGVSHGSCSKGWDNDKKTLGSKIFLPVFYTMILACVALLATSSKRIRGQELGTGSDDEERSPGGGQKPRRFFLDFARFASVCCVVAYHSGGEIYSEHNTLFVLSWVMPFLWLTSGICFMLSSKHLMSYMLRLAVLFLIGTCANWIVDSRTRRDWQGHFGDTIFQMFYVVGLAIMAIIACPLRAALRSYHQTGVPVKVASFQVFTFVVTVLTILGFVYFVKDKPITPSVGVGSFAWVELLENLDLVLIQVFGMLSMASIACTLGTTDMLGWILLLLIYLPRVVLPWQQVGFVHNVELYIFAMVTEIFPLRGHRLLVQGIQAYWPMFFGILLILSMPDMHGRCDLLPPYSALERFRFYLSGCLLTVCFVTGTFYARDSEGVTGWLTAWALWAYLFHVAIARVLPVPYGAVLTYCSLVVFFVVHRLRRIYGNDGAKAEESFSSLPSSSNDLSKVGRSLARS